MYKELNPVYKIVSFTEAKRRGDCKKVADLTGYSCSHVCNTLKGRRSNKSIVNAAYRLVKDRSTNLQLLAKNSIV